MTTELPAAGRAPMLSAMSDRQSDSPERQERSVSMPVGVLIERRAIDNPWQKWRWLPVAVVPGAAEIDNWREMERDGDAVRWHAATMMLKLHRKETEAYRANLECSQPGVWVVLRPVEDAPAERAVRPHLVTLSAYEAQDYVDVGEDIVERVGLPPSVRAWAEAFIARHHVEEPFRKRKRKRYDPDEAGFGRRPDHPDLAARRRPT
jgi:hypothetical protein